ncbi:hypothetical protein [Dysgonomonas sp. ZJ279]|uniref:hypothetical protein n=1 Tax=Dysgonomonas sp. ZJ279 TaxID=2709796 RepID=UPI0013EC1D55|nr:hypothetical protein [Dysgonomonas sp. ZJ279]
MKSLIYILILFALLGCRSAQKSVSETSVNEQINVTNDIAFSDDSYLYETISRAFQQVIAERFNFTSKQTKYDTDKPIDPNTGKPPISEEIETSFDRATDTTITDTTKTTIASGSHYQFVDKGTTGKTIKTSLKVIEEKGLKDWQKYAICFGGLCLLIYFKLKY